MKCLFPLLVCWVFFPSCSKTAAKRLFLATWIQAHVLMCCVGWLVVKSSCNTCASIHAGHVQVTLVFKILLIFPTRRQKFLQRVSERSCIYKAHCAETVALWSFSCPIPHLCPGIWQHLKTGWASVGNERSDILRSCT